MTVDPRVQALIEAPLRSAKTRQPPAAKADRCHYATPGSGPLGETCGSCRHLARVQLARTYLKCERMRAHWTGGAGTDIKARDRACSGWERR